MNDKNKKIYVPLDALCKGEIEQLDRHVLAIQLALETLLKDEDLSIQHVRAFLLGMYKGREL